MTRWWSRGLKFSGLVMTQNNIQSPKNLTGAKSIIKIDVKIDIKNDILIQLKTCSKLIEFQQFIIFWSYLLRFYLLVYSFDI